MKVGYQYERSDNYSKEERLEDAIIKPDLSYIETKDPSLSKGYTIIFNKEVPLDLKLETEDGLKDIGTIELINFKLLSNSTNKEDETEIKIKIELSWEKDLFFHYTNVIKKNDFEDIKKNQNLNINFTQYGNIIRTICDNCINSPDLYKGKFIIKKGGISKLKFIKVTDLKLLDLLTLEFKNSSDKIIKKQILYKFASLKSKLEYNKKVLKAAGDVIMESNPDVMQPILEKNDNYNLDINKFFDNINEGK